MANKIKQQHELLPPSPKEVKNVFLFVPNIIGMRYRTLFFAVYLDFYIVLNVSFSLFASLFYRDKLLIFLFYINKFLNQA
jgi:hypothetical protein